MMRFKKIYKIVLAAAAVLMLISQVLLMNNSVKPILSTVYSLEEKYSKAAEKCGTVRISVSNPSDTLYLMQNGEITASLSEREFEIEVADNTVVEIDGLNSDKCLIKITQVSGNLDGYYDENITVDKNIAILGRFFVK